MEELGLFLPEILLPREGIDLTKWAVIACDQYTSERDYWEKVKEFVGDSPSTLHMIFPECYLEEGNPGQRIKRIHSVMRQYLKEGILSPAARVDPGRPENPVLFQERPAGRG